MAGWSKALFFILMVLCAGYASTHMMTAGDTWLALASGRQIAAHGVRPSDPFSANSIPPGPTNEALKRYPPIVMKLLGGETIRAWLPTGWINQNWLTHLLFYRLSTLSAAEKAAENALPWLVVWKFAIYLLAGFLIYDAARLLEADAAIAAILACAALLIARSFLDIRPAGFSNLFSIVFLVILLLATYRNVRWIWTIVPLAVLWSNLHGGFVYLFYMMAAFLAAHLGAIFLGKPSVALGRRGLKHAAGAALASLIAVVVFNPFHISNLTHTLVVSFSRDAETWREVNEWHGAFEWGNRVGTGVPFLLLLIAWTVCFAVWLLVGRLDPDRHHGPPRDHEPKDSGRLAWPRIDLGILMIAGLTMAMAVKSRRFIPMAAFVACPVLAMMFDQVLKMMTVGSAWVKARKASLPKFPAWILPGVTASGIFAGFTAWMAATDWRGIWHGHQTLLIVVWTVLAALSLAALFLQIVRISGARRQSAGLSTALPAPPPGLKKTVPLLALAAVVLVGLSWGGRFKKSYLDPWPADAGHTSVFMRMTASYLKPFEACAFLRENKVGGVIFNEWTDGGFIAWSQEPDPVTGKPPLQVFIDGRSQGAYGIDAYRLWKSLCQGGPVGERLTATRRPPTAAEDREIGDWITGRLAAKDVWLVLAPPPESGTATRFLTEELEKHPDWRSVYFDGLAKILVRVADLRGKKLFDDVASGAARFPSRYAEALSQAQVLVRLDDADSITRGLELAGEAFKIKPSPAPLLVMYQAYHGEENTARIDRICREWMAEFDEGRGAFATDGGRMLRLFAAVVAADHIIQVGTDDGEKRRWGRAREGWLEEIEELGARERW